MWGMSEASVRWMVVKIALAYMAVFGLVGGAGWLLYKVLCG